MREFSEVKLSGSSLRPSSHPIRAMLDALGPALAPNRSPPVPNAILTEYSYVGSARAMDNPGNLHLLLKRRILSFEKLCDIDVLRQGPRLRLARR